MPVDQLADQRLERLAVLVEDHPIEYGEFEGVIPPGYYGAGTVLLWDRGTYSCREGDPAEAFERGKMTIDFDGERLRGEKVNLTFGEWLEALRLPFSVLKARITGDDFVYEYAFSQALFIASLHMRLRTEEANDHETWDQLTRDDPAFAAATDRGIAALNGNCLVEVDWTAIRPVTR